jgi:hypothetical protein
MDIANGMILPFFTSGIKIRVNLMKCKWNRNLNRGILPFLTSGTQIKVNVMIYQWNRYCEQDDFANPYIRYPN